MVWEIGYKFPRIKLLKIKETLVEPASLLEKLLHMLYLNLFLPITIPCLEFLFQLLRLHHNYALGEPLF